MNIRQAFLAGFAHGVDSPSANSQEQNEMFIGWVATASHSPDDEKVKCEDCQEVVLTSPESIAAGKCVRCRILRNRKEQGHG